MTLSISQIINSSCPTSYSCHLQPVIGPGDHFSNSKDKELIPNWNKLSKEDIHDKYTTHVESQLSSLHLPDPDEFLKQPDLIDNHLEALANILQSIALANIPSKAFQKHLA